MVILAVEGWYQSAHAPLPGELRAEADGLLLALAGIKKGKAGLVERPLNSLAMLTVEEVARARRGLRVA